MIKKLRLVRDNAQRMHVANKVKTKACDARKATEIFAAGEFTKILVDAPCSGLGLLRRKPEIRYTKRQQDLQNLQKNSIGNLNCSKFTLKKRMASWFIQLAQFQWKKMKR